MSSILQSKNTTYKWITIRRCDTCWDTWQGLGACPSSRARCRMSTPVCSCQAVFRTNFSISFFFFLFFLFGPQLFTTFGENFAEIFDYRMPDVWPLRVHCNASGAVLLRWLFGTVCHGKLRNDSESFRTQRKQDRKTCKKKQIHHHKSYKSSWHDNIMIHHHWYILIPMSDGNSGRKSFQMNFRQLHVSPLHREPMRFWSGKPPSLRVLPRTQIRTKTWTGTDSQCQEFCIFVPCNN